MPGLKPGPKPGPKPPGGMAGACVRLAQIFSNNATFTPESPYYTDLSHAHWNHAVWEEPPCVFIPESAADLQTALPIITEERSKFSIRSGGHNPALGAAATHEGVLIDMSRFDQLEYDADNSVAHVGPGRRWGEVYNYLDNYEVTVVGGRVLPVGVGGLPLGSGLSYLSDMYGLACDNVVNFEVILADGSLVNANLDENSDLFYALKGGSNNFGIVVGYTLKTYNIHNIWGGTRVIAFDQVDNVLDAVLAYQSSPDRDPYASMNLNLAATNQTDLGIILTLIYLKPEPNPAVFAPFDAIPALVDTVRVQTLTSAMGEFPVPDLPRVRFLASTFEPSKALHDKIVHIMTTSPHVQTIKNANGGTGVFSWQAIPPRLVQAGIDAGGNALGLKVAHQSWFHIDCLWNLEKDDKAISVAAHALMAEIVTEAKKLNVHLDYIFMNDASETQDVIGSYGAENNRKLKEVSKRVDPNKVFQKQCAGAWKL